LSLEIDPDFANIDGRSDQVCIAFIFQWPTHSHGHSRLILPQRLQLVLLIFSTF
jgi:hypothetical protein